MWCNDKCICQEENVKLFCREVNEKDVFKYTELTREIEMKQSMVGLDWVTRTFGNLQKVSFVQCNVLDCETLYVVKVIGACDEERNGVDEERNVVNELKSKGVTLKSVQNWVKKQTFDITVSVLVVGGILFGFLGVVMIRQRLIKRYLRIREERMAYMTRLGGFDFDQAEEDRANAENTVDLEVVNKG